jgi:four helix bundle protein
MSEGYRSLAVWQASFELTEAIYKLTKRFPEDKKYGMSSQMRRAAISIPSNIAEGYRRRSIGEWRQFTGIAYGSASELETQCALAKKLSLAPGIEFTESEELLAKTLRLLNGFFHYLQNHK